MSLPLNPEAVAEVKRQMPENFTIPPDSLVVHPSWLKHKDGSPMVRQRARKRLVAIERLIKIKTRSLEVEEED